MQNFANFLQTSAPIDLETYLQTSETQVYRQEFGLRFLKMQSFVLIVHFIVHFIVQMPVEGHVGHDKGLVLVA